MSELIKVLNYQGNDVNFRTHRGSVFVNATEMAKAFNKRTSDYLATQSTQSFIDAYIRNNPDTVNPVTVSKGGENQGTWMHEDIALDFAQWLSVDFRMWCNKKIKELMTTGKAELTPPSPLEIARRLLFLEEEKIKADEKIALDAPKVLFADSVSESKDSVLVKELSGYLSQNGVKKMGQNKLFEWLRKNGYLCVKWDYYNLPTQRALDLKLFEVKKTAINKPDGTILTSTTTKVTGKGLIYFLNKFNNSVA